MDSPTLSIAISTLVCGLLMFFLSLPLIFRKVPMNKLYGIRLKASFESEQRWYDINAYGGKQMALWSWPIIAIGIAGFFVPSSCFNAYAWTAAAVTLVAILIPTGLTWRWIRKK